MPLYHALSLHQPWANLISSGRKTIETRRWQTRYRGELLLCASKLPNIAPSGCAVCLVELVDCRPMQAEDWSAACIEVYAPAFGWHLRNIRPVVPVPIRGALGIFSIEIPELSLLG
jgi:hypothetical protein